MKRKSNNSLKVYSLERLKNEYEPYRLLIKAKIPLSNTDAECAHALQQELKYELEKSKLNHHYLAMLLLEVAALRLNQFQASQDSVVDESVEQLEFERYGLTFQCYNN